MWGMTKIERFAQGWKSVAPDIIYPSAKRIGDKFKTWEEIVEPLNLFECYEAGRREATIYVNAIGYWRERDLK